MAPIDCSGVVRAHGFKWFCKICSLVHRDKGECSFYHPFHNPLTSVPNSVGDGVRGLPHILEITERGVRCKVPVKAFTRFGPLVGRNIREEEMDFDEDRRKVFIIYTDDGKRALVVASVPGESNWVREVRSAPSSQAATVLAISSQDQLYLVTTADLGTGTELTFYSREDPTTEFWTSWTEAWCNQVSRNSDTSFKAKSICSSM